MNVKVWFVTALLVVSILSVSSVAPVSSSHTPSSTDDGLFEPFGPRPSQLLIKIYSDYMAELAAFKNKEFDFMDWGLDPIDYQYFESIDPTHSQYATAFYTEFALFEYDLNNAAMPMSIKEFRQALSHIADKDYFINTYLLPNAAKMDSPIGSLPGWYDPSLTDLYNLAPRTTMTPLPDDWADWQAAYDLFSTALGAPIVDPEDSSYYTWAWTTPPPLNVANGTFPAVANNHLLFFVRSDSGPRCPYQGDFLKTALENALPAILQAHGLPRARIHVDLYNVPRAVTSIQVMRYYRYHIYTGGWTLNRDPDSLTIYVPSQYFYYHNQDYVGYNNPAYDAEVNAMLSAPRIGNSTNPGDAKYHAYRAQNIFMNDAVIIPMWSFAGYKPYLSDWRGVVNQAGFGANSWWTFLNAHTIGSEGSDVIRYGWEGDVVSLNVISAQWYWDWEVLGKVYDSLIAVNPYDVSQDLPYLAKNWTIGTYGVGNTKITFNLRGDIWWQDVPFKDRSAITFDGSHSIDGPFQAMPFTPIDVAFSLLYIRDNLDSWNGYLAGPVDHVAVNMGIWGSLWSSSKPGWYTADTRYGIPWQTNYVQNDPTLGASDITVYLNQPMSWIGLHWIGGIPITPYHIWRYITQWNSLGVNTIGNDIIYGTGPWIFLTRTPGVSLTMIPYVTGQSYRGITLQNSYFYQPVRPPGDLMADENALESMNSQTGVVSFSNELKNYASTPLDVNAYFDYDIQYSFDGITWTTVGTGNTTPQAVPIAVGETVTVAEPNVATIPPDGLKPNAIVRVHVSMHWSYVDAASWLANFTGYYGDFSGTTPEQPAYWSAVWLKGDINGDCIVDISDAAIIGIYWQNIVPPTPPEVDINCDGIVDIQDAAMIGINWQKQV